MTCVEITSECGADDLIDKLALFDAVGADSVTLTMNKGGVKYLLGELRVRRDLRAAREQALQALEAAKAARQSAEAAQATYSEAARRLDWLERHFYSISTVALAVLLFVFMALGGKI